MPREMDVRKETCGENKRPQEKDMPRERETAIQKVPRLQEKEIPWKKHAERNGCQERDMPREKETSRKRHAKGKRDVKKKMPRLQEKEIVRKRHAERNGCQERDMPRE